MPEATDRIAARADELLASELHSLHARTDRLFMSLMVVQWIGTIAAALFIAPHTWIGAQSMVNLHVWMALMLGGALAAGPIFMAWRHPGARTTRCVVAVAQVLFSTLLIHVSGGRIETHFHVFVSLAFLAIYRDLGVLVIATVIVAGDHLLRGLFWPESVFGTLTVSTWRWAEHAAWVIFEDLVLVYSIRQGMREMRLNARRAAELELSYDHVEQLVVERTRALDEALHRAEASNRCKTDFLANMSHEIRTPMTAILGFADLLGSSTSTVTERADAVSTIQRNGDHLLAVINDILDISKLESGHLDVERVPCAPAELLQQVVELLHVRAEAKGLNLQLEGGSPIPATISSDPTRVLQILTNIVGNAIKFTERGQVRVVASRVPGENVLRIDVIDSGIGIEPEHGERLFEPFQQSDTTMTRRFGGTGLGLAIARQLARQLGGDVTFTSVPSRGTTFTITLDTGPLDDVDVVRLADVQSRRDGAPAPGPDDDARRPLTDVRVLLAEDGPDNQRLIAHVLRRAGADVTIVDNGERAVDAAIAAHRTDAPYDVVLMDMQMPVLDGYGAVAQLRAEDYAGPIVALTAHAMSGDRERCLDAGCDDFATKPIDRAQLVQTVAEWAQPSSSHSTA